MQLLNSSLESCNQWANHERIIKAYHSWLTPTQNECEANRLSRFYCRVSFPSEIKLNNKTTKSQRSSRSLRMPFCCLYYGFVYNFIFIYFFYFRFEVFIEVSFQWISCVLSMKHLTLVSCRARPVKALFSHSLFSL